MGVLKVQCTILYQQLVMCNYTAGVNVRKVKRFLNVIPNVFVYMYARSASAYIIIHVLH